MNIDVHESLTTLVSTPTPILPTTLPPTTVLPTTIAPTTLLPTTIAPTTLLPTTVAPTTQIPTTIAPTTHIPTTIPPTTPVPTTLLPTTIPPTTLPPTTIAPTTVIPTTIPPTTLPPTTTVPTTQSPTTVIPTTLPPTTLSPTTLPPTTQLPTTQIPTIPPAFETCIYLSSLSLSDSDLVIPTNTCNNENLTNFDISAFKNLEYVEISDDNFYFVTSFRIVGLPYLSDIIIGRNNYLGNSNQSFVISHCQLLMSIQIGRNSFTHYENDFIIEECPLLEYLILEGYNFHSSPFVLNSMIIIYLKYRYTSFE